MHFLELIFLSIALGIDCLIVSFSQGLIFTDNRLKNSLALAITMGISQSAMPVLGYFGIGTISKYIESYSPWLVFAIFFILGLNIIRGTLSQTKDEEFDCYFCFKYILLVSIATSIDALFAGVSISFAQSDILFAAALIGLITFINSLIGFWCGNFLKNLSTNKLEVVGGVILILLAFKVLFVGLLQ